MENTITKRVIALCVFAFGMHLVTFNEQWSKDTANFVERSIRSKWQFVRVFFGINPFYGYQRAVTVVAGVFFIAWRIAFFMSTQKDG
jgi:hypothetical protein